MLGNDKKRYLLIFFIICLMFFCTVAICFFGHDCIGDKCEICFGIDLIENVIDGLLISTLFYVFINISDMYFDKIYHMQILKYKLTPIGLKDRLIE